MAQWMRQYTGQTHESKVIEIENCLLKTIEVLKKADESDKEKKKRSVLKLCKRLLIARHQAIKARISKLSGKHDSKKTQNLVKRKHILEDGVNGILVEFKIQGLFNIETAYPASRRVQ